MVDIGSVAEYGKSMVVEAKPYIVLYNCKLWVIEAMLRK